MKLLLFSDLHRDKTAAKKLLDLSGQADVMVGAGDFATCRKGVTDCIEILCQAECPAVFVAGNGESHEELELACRAWKNCHVLHGAQAKVAGTLFFGIGGAIPVTPFGSWSWDHTEEQASKLVANCPENCVIVSHSPPLGIADSTAQGEHKGSATIRHLIDRCSPKLLVCGHIHDSWEEKTLVDGTLVVNAGPQGVLISL